MIVEWVLAMKALVTGSGGLIGSECVRQLSAEGWEVVGIDNDMRRQFFGEQGTTDPVVRGTADDAAALPALAYRYPRPAGRPAGARSRAAAIHHSHRRAAFARQSRRHPLRRFRRECAGHHEHAGGGARFLPGIAVLFHQHQQSLRRPAQLPAADRTATSATTMPAAWTAWTRACRSTSACIPSLALPR